MAHLTKNFEDWEFRCSHCGKDGVSQDLVEALQSLRDSLDRPVHVVSGYRCELHPLTISRPGSAHAMGLAADVVVFGIPVRELFQRASLLNIFHGFGVNDAGRTLHLDVAQRVARWCYDENGCEVPWRDA